MLAKIMYDEDRDCEYSPLCCMNDEKIKNRIQIAGAKPVIFTINATQTLNSDIAIDFKNVLVNKRINFLVNYNQAVEEILPNIKEYRDNNDVELQVFFEHPFLETQLLISETTSLIYEKLPQTGLIKISEQGNNRKDRYTSVSYGSYFISLLEKDLFSDTSGADLADFSKYCSKINGNNSAQSNLISKIFR